MTILKFGHLEELFGICQIKMSLFSQDILHIFPCALGYTKDRHTKPYQMLWANLEKLLSLLTMDLYQMLCKCHELLK